MDEMTEICGIKGCNNKRSCARLSPLCEKHYWKKVKQDWIDWMRENKEW